MLLEEIHHQHEALASRSNKAQVECPQPGTRLLPFIILPIPLPIIQLFIYSSKARLLGVKSYGSLWIFLPPERRLGTG